LGTLSSAGISSARDTYNQQRYSTSVGGTAANLLPGVALVRLLMNASEESSQGQQGFAPLYRGYQRLNPFASNEGLEASESVRQRDTRFLNQSRQNPDLVSSINRQVQGIIYNALAEPGQINRTDTSIRSRIRTAIPQNDLRTLAANRGQFGENAIENLLSSSYFQSSRTLANRRLVLGDANNPQAELTYGLTRFSKELQNSADILQNFSRTSSEVTDILTGSTRIGGAVSQGSFLENPLKTPEFFGAVTQATSGLGEAGSFFSRPANLAGQIGSIAPELLRAYLRGGNPNNPIPEVFEEDLRSRLGNNIRDGSLESNFISNFSNQARARIGSNGESFLNPSVAERLVRDLLVDSLQPIIELNKQRERIGQSIVQIEQQTLNLTLRRAEYLGRAADIDTEILKIREQQANIREGGAGGRAFNRLSFEQVNRPFETRINTIGARAGIDSTTSIPGIENIVNSLRQSITSTQSSTLEPEVRNRLIAGFNDKLIIATRILDQYANSTQRASYYLEQLGRNQAERSGRIDLQRRFIMGSDEDRSDLLTGGNIAQYVLRAGDNNARQLAFQQLGLPARQSFLRYTDAARDIRTGGANQETFGGAASQILYGQIPEESRTALENEQTQNLEKLNGIYEEASKAAAALAAIAQNQITTLGNDSLSQNNKLLDSLNASIQRLITRMDPANQNAIVPRTPPPIPVGPVTVTPAPPRPIERVSQGGEFGFWAKGGPVYANNGMMMPRGTDTVPAMLTPNEFVINRDSSIANRSLLEHINNAKGPVNFTDLPRHYERGISPEKLYGGLAIGGLSRGIGTIGALGFADGGNIPDLEEITRREQFNRGNQLGNVRGANPLIQRAIDQAMGEATGQRYHPEDTVLPGVRPGIRTHEGGIEGRVREILGRTIDPNQIRLPGVAPAGYDDAQIDEMIVNAQFANRNRIADEQEREQNQRGSNTIRGLLNLGRGLFGQNSIGDDERQVREAENLAARQTVASQFNARFAGFSPAGIDGISNLYGASAGAFAYQQGATSNLLRQQLLSQTRSRAFGGSLGAAQRAQRASILNSQAQANRRFLGNQPSLRPEDQLLRYLGRRRFAEGGYVDGEDTVPAMLSEGEFVMNRAATSNIGPANLARMQHFAQGGLVGDSDAAQPGLGDSSELMAALNNFARNNSDLVEALRAFPHIIEGSFRHEHQVNVNGLSVFQDLEGAFSELMTGIAEQVVENLLKDQLPDLGRSQTTLGA
jgi:hypothetical protein